MKKQVTKYYILLLLIMVFAAPGIAAYVFYQHPGWLGAAKVNKGALLNPPVFLSALNKQSKWRIVFWSPGDCNKACMQQLDILARIRLALGRKLYEVDQCLILGDKASPLSPEMKSLLGELDFQVVHLSETKMNGQKLLSTEARVFLANPDNYLILSYQAEVNPDDIYKDLKFLLNTAESANG